MFKRASLALALIAALMISPVLSNVSKADGAPILFSLDVSGVNEYRGVVDASYDRAAQSIGLKVAGGVCALSVAAEAGAGISLLIKPNKTAKVIALTGLAAIILCAGYAGYWISEEYKFQGRVTENYVGKLVDSVPGQALLRTIEQQDPEIKDVSSPSARRTAAEAATKALARDILEGNYTAADLVEMYFYFLGTEEKVQIQSEIEMAESIRSIKLSPAEMGLVKDGEIKDGRPGWNG